MCVGCFAGGESVAGVGVDVLDIFLMKVVLLVWGVDGLDWKGRLEE